MTRDVLIIACAAASPLILWRIMLAVTRRSANWRAVFAQQTMALALLVMVVLTQTYPDRPALELAAAVVAFAMASVSLWLRSQVQREG